jgi:hypothetical protein
MILSCSIVGEIEGFRGVVRRLASLDEVCDALGSAGVARERYAALICDFKPGSKASFDINLNEAQKLGIIQTDTSE